MTIPTERLSIASEITMQSTPLYQKALGSLIGGIIGDAIGTPTENMRYAEIEAKYGWVADFDSDGTDDTVMKNLLAEALIQVAAVGTSRLPATALHQSFTPVETQSPERAGMRQRSRLELEGLGRSACFPKRCLH